MVYLETIDVTKSYARHLALNNVSIRVEKGSVYGLLGPNGAGKTTLIRIINRITAPDTGAVYINGRPSQQDDVYSIGYLPEERGLYKKMKVGEQALFLAQLKGLSKTEARKRIDYWFEKFEIASWWNRKVEELSKGMQQKVQFITAVIHDPELLILDEPFSGFDPVNAELLKNEILGLKAQGKTIILSTHNMESVESLCDEISLINLSQIALSGNVSEIKKRYNENIFTLKVAGNNFSIVSPLFSTISTATENGLTIARIQKTGACGNSELLRDIVGKYEVLSFDEELPTMNDIFIKTVNGN
ncbi:MAG: ATP-binding cassette domain-containing protein [Prevotella sp.]|jgi:ABC-2 type transport system ATP-binding protein|nr:ATP-binding cassette domain-containing protein [Prevotella sp.]